MEPKVLLVFPPLVNTNFGSYYPSTAVLAAYLKRCGIDAKQADLNEEFAKYILQEEVLDKLSHYDFDGAGNTSVGRFAKLTISILKRTKHELFDANGCHRFRPGSSRAAGLLTDLAERFRIDLRISDLAALDATDWPASAIYRTFFQHLPLDGLIPASVVLFGLSVPMGPQVAPSLLLIEHIKRTRPHLRIVVGGPAFSLMNESDRSLFLRSFHNVDALVRFDGERPLEALARQCIEGRWEPASVPGVSSRSGTTVVDIAPMPGHKLTALPYPEYDPDIMARLSAPELGITQARGCYWGQCSYCDFIELYDGSPSVRSSTAARFVDEMEAQIARYGVSRFCVITESIPPGFAGRFCAEIAKRQLKVTWNSFAMVDRHFTKRLLNQMVESGCEFLVIGLETVNDRVLKLVRKASRRADIMRFLLDARDTGLDLKVNLIPNLPSTTASEAMEALEALRKVQDCFSAVSVFPFEATQSSDVGRNPAHYKLVVDEQVRVGGHQAQYASNHLAARDPAMTDDERREVLAAYKAFEWEVNGRKLRGAIATPDWITQDNLVQLSAIERNLDPSSGERITLFNWRRGQFLEVPAHWNSLIDALQHLGVFRPSQFARYLAVPDTGREVLQTLARHGLLESASAEQ